VPIRNKNTEKLWNWNCLLWNR